MGAKRILLGVVGDSAAGKTTISRGIQEALGPERVTVVCTDDYHRYNRRQRREMGISALHPDCNYIDIIEQHLRLLREGQPILKPVYNHSTGDFDPPVYVRPAEFVIVEGLLAFHTKAMRQCFDVKVYLDPPEALRRVWKVKRDTAKRGYTVEEVLASLRKREGDSARFIRPQRRYADIVVRFYPPAGVAPEQANGHLNVRLVLRPTIPHPDMTTVLEPADEGGQSAIRLSLGRDEGRPVEFLEIDGNVPPEKAADLERLIWHHIPEVADLRLERLGIYLNGLEERHSDPLALVQLLIAYHLVAAQIGVE
ncbi:MAG: phosphoribulokinase [Chloroflexi bacterium]|nr:MAG: phosphoribulokinase [Chloroflexota bacterium]